MVTQVEIARRLGLDVSSVNKILNKREGPVFKKDTIRKVFRIAREMGYDFGKLKYVHRRRHPRREVSIATEIAIYSKDGTLHDQGVATVRDLSQCGARVSDIALPQNTLPTEPFTVTLRPMVGPLDDIELRGRIVRLDMEQSTSFGIDFGKVDTAVLKRIKKITN
jgi:transcriptional regulator with XRE-family HTH domain